MSDRVAAQTQQTADVGRRLEMHAHEMTSRMTFASAKKGALRSNTTKKRALDGSRHRGRQPKKPETDWIQVPKPELRIVDTSVSDVVDQRLATKRHAYLRDVKGRVLGRPRGSADGKHLLAGFIQCACSATFEAVRGQYTCSARRRKGPAACPSDLSFPVEGMDHIFLDTIEGTLLQPAFVNRIVDDAFAVAPDVQRAALLHEQARLTTEITNLTAAIASGGDIPSLADALKTRDSRLRVITAQLAQPVVIPDREVLRAALELRTGQWREVLRGQHIAQARLVLQHLVELPLKVDNAPPPPHIKQGSRRGVERWPKWTVGVRPQGLAVGLIHKLASPTRTNRSQPSGEWVELDRWVAA